MKKYIKPVAEKMIFNYIENIVASYGNETHNGDVGHGIGMGSGCDQIPGHGNPKSDHPVFGVCD